MDLHIRIKWDECMITMFFLVLSLLFILPILLMVSISFSDSEMLLKGYSFIPKKFSLEAFEFIFSKGSAIVSAYSISIFVTAIGTMLAVSIMALCAYAISKNDYRFAKIISFLIFFTMLFSGGLVPTYLLITKYLNMKDTIWVLILPTLIAPFHVMLMKAFFTDLPKEIFESAYIDGANEIYTFAKIAVPISKPIFATVALFTILRYWNDWFSAMLYIQNEHLIPIQYFLYRLIDNFEAFENQFTYYSTVKVFPKESIKMAVALITALPLLMVYPFLQKYFVKGLTVGAIKA